VFFTPCPESCSLIGRKGSHVPIDDVSHANSSRDPTKTIDLLSFSQSDWLGTRLSHMYYSYSVSLSLIKDLNGKVLASVDGVFSSPSCATGASDYDFVVTFKEPALLRKGDEYELECRTSGPQSWYGTERHQTICCHGVTFFLKDTCVWYSSLRTNTKQGQIKEFVYSLVPSNIS